MTKENKLLSAEEMKNIKVLMNRLTYNEASKLISYLREIANKK